MKKLMIFILENCPYCRAALADLKECQKLENYQDIVVELIEERAEKEIAETYDYYYVPAFYYNGNKLHEGAINKSELVDLLDRVVSESE